jgi:hypothetical protein
MQDRFKLPFLLSVVGTVILAGFVAFGAAMWRQMRDTAERSCFASVKATVQVIVATNGVAITNLPPGGERLLSRSEVDAILHLSGGLDCVRYRDSEGMPVDAWGQPFYVRVANTEAGLQAEAFSSGKDGRPGTADDIH